MGPRRVYLVGDVKNPRVRLAFDDLVPWLEQRVEVTGFCTSDQDPFDPGEAELVIILGGDGAILWCAERLGGRGTPCVGIRVGHFGFLAELDPSMSRPYLERIFAGEGQVIERDMLACVIRRADGATLEALALNDAVVTASQPARMVTLHLQVDGELVAIYRGDGLIVSTPLGSTAHSLAAGGPVVEPDANSILVTPLAPHSLSSRPLVLHGARKLVIRVGGHRGREAALALDGQRTHAVDDGDEVRIERAEPPFRLMTIVERSFFATLREKFRWAGSVLDGDEVDPDDES